jgi:hypothetical protein
MYSGMRAYSAATESAHELVRTNDMTLDLGTLASFRLPFFMRRFAVSSSVRRGIGSSSTRGPAEWRGLDARDERAGSSVIMEARERLYET